MIYILGRNIVTLFLILGFTVQLFIGNIFDKKTENFFKFIALCLFILFFVDIVDSYLSTLNTPNNFRYITSGLGYTVRPIALGFFIEIALRKKEKTLNSTILFWSPIIFNGILSMTNIFTKLMFCVDASNEFHRGPLSFVPHIISAFYMIILGYVSTKEFKFSNKNEALPVFYIIIICLLSMVLETFYGFKFLLTGSIICGSLFYYTYIYVQVYKTDIATNLLNRHTFHIDLDKRLKNSMYFILVDLNDLKIVNDNDGHIAGDTALLTVAAVLQEHSCNNFSVYRLGGDEFGLLCVNASEEDIKTYIQNVNNSLSKTNYSVSIGYAHYIPGSNFDDVVELADEKMYKNKIAYKKTL